VVQIGWPGFSEEAKFIPRAEERAEEEGWVGQSSQDPRQKGSGMS